MEITQKLNKGIVSDIQLCSLHDGPGIRTTIFLKGCNFQCKWCHNPETVYRKPEILYYPDRCIGCGMCEFGCYSGAKVVCGKEMTVEEVLNAIENDYPYYGAEGGITVSGGEPLLQYDFVRDLFEAVRSRNIKIAIETNLSLETNKVLELASYCQVIMCDLKAMDDDVHKKYTNASNANVLTNMLEIDKLNIPIIVRTPVIKDVNENQVEKICAFLKMLNNLEYYELLTYHPLGLSKNARFKAEKFEKLSKDEMIALGKKAKEYGLPIRIDNTTV